MATVPQDRLEPVEADPQAVTMCAAFQATAARYADEVALRTPDGSTELTFSDYADRVRAIASGLAALGVHRGDTVGILLANRPEFHLVDTAAIHLGATPFSIYPTSSPEQIAHVFSNARNTLVVTEEQFLGQIEKARFGNVSVEHVITVDGSGDDTMSLAEMESQGAQDFDFEAAWRAVEPDDVLTLIYTSGTTGPPKGVQLTHANMLAECRGMAQVLPIRPGARITSYLPSAHIADRWSSHYSQMLYGIQITAVADARAVAKVLPDLKPTIWGGVPRVVEKLKAALEGAIAGDENAERRAAVQGAIEIGIQKVRLEQAGEPVPPELAAKHVAAEEKVLSGLRAKLGLDQAEWIIIGAAPLSREVHEFLLGIGLPVVELYGMSECACCVTISATHEVKVGTVGRAIPGVEITLADDGEMLVRGDTIMAGYRGDPERTAEAVDADGWLHTGDIAEIDDEGYVKIIDRKKELIINAGGKNMSPANIEQHLKDASPLIGQAAAIGDRRPYNVALIVLDPDAAASYAKEHRLADASVEAVAKDPGVQQAVSEAVAAANERLARVEQIKRYELLHEEWQPGGDELTPTMKLKRKPINEKYAALIEALYAREG